MMKFITLLTSLLITILVHATPSDDFVITVKTDNPGLSGNSAFTIPTRPALTYKYDVDCNDDGTYEVLDANSDYTCDYSGLGGPGTYTLRVKSDVTDSFPAIHFNDSGDKDKILTVQQWGKNPWLVMDSAFQGASNLTITATDAPDLSAVSSTFEMFKDAVSVDTDLAGWDVTNINVMNGMFSGVTLSRANYDAILISFNNQNVIDGVPFDAGNSKYCAILARQNLVDNAAHNWDILDGGQGLGCPDPTDDFVITVKTDNPGVSTNTQFRIHTNSLETYDYSVDCDNNSIYEIASATGDYTCQYPSSGTYTLRIKYNRVTNAGFPSISFFGVADADKLLTIEQWGTNPWTTMNSAFRNANNLLTTATDIPDFSNLNSLNHMFRDAGLVNPNTSNWDTSSIETMESMFNGATSANPDTSNWDTSSVTTMFSMFRGATSANPDTSSWNTSLVENMVSMFNGAISANPDTSNWNIENVGFMLGMFSGVTLPSLDYDAILIGFSQQNVKQNVFFSGGNSKYCTQSAHDILAVDNNWNINDDGIDTNCNSFDDFVITVKTDNPGFTIPEMFRIPTKPGLTYNYNVDCNDDGINEATAQTGDYFCDYSVGGLNLGAGTYTIRIKDNTGTGDGFPSINFNNTFDRLKIITVEKWGTGKWTNMQRAFYGAENLTFSTIEGNPDFSSVTTMEGMFWKATLANPKTTNWDTSSVTDMRSLFNQAENAQPDTSLWDTHLVEDMSFMFRQAFLANPDTSLWDTSKVLSMSSMFNQASIATPDTSSWDTAMVNNMSFMFRLALVAEPDVSSWNVEQVGDFDNMFIGTTLSTTTYDNLLITFDAQNVQANKLFHGGNSKYCAIAAHDNLDMGDNWTITDGGMDTNCPSPLDDFVITVKTDHLGTSADNEFTIPTNLGQAYDYSVDCDNDGINDILGATGDSTCIYPSAGTYTIRIKYNQATNAGFPRIYFNGNGDTQKLLTIEQWGTNPWASMSSAFEGASHLTTTALDVPDFSNMTFMFQMFKNATLVTPNTSNWNTSSIVTMFEMFRGATSANPDTSNWNIENVTTMNRMFLGVTLPTASYDAILINFSQQIVKQNINFHGGSSKYCALIAHDILDINNGWTIIDGGLDTNCPPLVEDVFSNGFEDVIIFKSTEAQFVYDFSQVSVKDLDENPLLIAKGINNQHQPTLLIYLRNDLGQLQIRQDFIDDENQWVQGSWESIENNKNTLIHWSK